jgi:hypothetical protein
VNQAVRTAVVAPTDSLGVFIITAVLAAVLAVAAAVTGGAEEPIEIVALSITFAMPVALLARRGHFGWTKWELPNAGAFIFLFWQVGICPSLIRLAPEVRVMTTFSDEAVVYGRIITIAWFALFSFALGRAPRAPVEGAADRSDEFGIGFAALVVVWGFAAVIAARYDALSYYHGASIEPGPEVGSSDLSLVFFYFSLAPMMLPAAVLVRFKGTRFVPTFATLALIVAVVGIFVFSSRRLWIVSLYLGLAVAQTCGPGLKKRWLVPAVVVAALGVGPLVWTFRGNRSGSQINDVVGNAWQSLTSYATDEEVREAASLTNADNLRVRMGLAGVIFTITDHELARGPNLSPTVLMPLVCAIPSVVWAGKIDFVQQFDAKKQFVDTGRFPPADMPVSPISEFIFQFGAIFAPLGGVLYGLAARLANASQRRAVSSLPRFIAWLGLVIALSFFDGGTIAFMATREPLALALVLWGITYVWQVFTGAPRDAATSPITRRPAA